MAREKIATAGSTASRFPIKPSESLAADRVLSTAEIDQYQGFLFAPTAGRNLDLPAEEACKGVVLFIRNIAGGAYTLTVRNDAGGTVIALTQNQASLIFCDGVAWSEVTS